MARRGRRREAALRPPPAQREPERLHPVRALRARLRRGRLAPRAGVRGPRRVAQGDDALRRAVARPAWRCVACASVCPTGAIRFPRTRTTRSTRPRIRRAGAELTREVLVLDKHAVPHARDRHRAPGRDHGRLRPVAGAQLQVRPHPETHMEPSQDNFPGLVTGIHQWACGLKGIHNLQGTWRDAEDGQLECGVVAHGSVDSTIGFNLHIKAGGTRVLYYWMAVGSNFEAVTSLNRMVRQRGPQSFIDRTVAFWRLWLRVHLPNMSEISPPVRDQYVRSLLTIRTQVDEGGTIIAANDSDISSDVRDTYSYMWSRDGALVAHALNKAGYLDLPRAFFRFCDQVHSREGYLLHKYNPDGSLASSWLPWAVDGEKLLPIQEDETSLVLWALWEHFTRYGDVSFIKPLYRSLICPLADFIAGFRESTTGLPLPSFDLWEERLGILSWTVAATWGGLNAAANFAQAFGETERAQNYRQAMEEIKAGADAHLWQPTLNRFARMVNRAEDGNWEVDATLDASLVGLWQFGMYPPDDVKIVPTMQAIRDQLGVKTSAGGIARYTNDRYHQVSQDISNVPGNPWFICTLWLAEWYSLTANNLSDLKQALDILEWVAAHALPSGILAEQVDPYTGQPLSVSPLTWSHAAYVSTVLTYLQCKNQLINRKKRKRQVL